MVETRRGAGWLAWLLVRRGAGASLERKGQVGASWVAGGAKTRGNLFELVRCENLSCLEGGLLLGKYVEQLIPFFHAIDHECR